MAGSLQIKCDAIGGGGSASASFVDTNKFKESDINFYLTVKVINQTINLKDALVFQPIPSVNKDNFTEVFGDTFISGRKAKLQGFR